MHRFEDTWELEDWPLFGGQLLMGHDSAPSADDSDYLDLRQDDLKSGQLGRPVGVNVEVVGSPGGFWTDDGRVGLESKAGFGYIDAVNVFGSSPFEERLRASAERSVGVARAEIISALPPLRPCINQYALSRPTVHTWPCVLRQETFEVGDITVPEVGSVGTDDDQQSPFPVDDVDELFSSDFLDYVDVDNFDPSPELFAFEDILSNITPDEVDSLLSSSPETPAIVFEFESSGSPALLEENPLYDEFPAYPMSISSSGGCGSVDGSVFDDSESVADQSLKTKSSRKTTARLEPYEASPAAAAAGPKVERRQRKKEQNKTAALRYRQKKREEHGVVLSEHELLEKRNIELKAKAEEMAKEISYLKGLMTELNIPYRHVLAP